MNHPVVIIAIAIVWHFVLLPIGLLWSLTLMGYEGGLTWPTFLGAMFFLGIIRAAVAKIPYS